MVLCGKGNNGGDGLVVARMLKESGCAPEVFLFSSPGAVEGDAAVNLKRWQQGLGELHVVESVAEWESARTALDGADLIVDALLGTGLRGPVEGLLGAVIEDVNARRGEKSRRKPAELVVVAVDMPSGLASDAQDFGGPVVSADFTVTLTAPKLGQMVSPRASSCGVLVVRGIGTPPELLESDPHLKIHWMEPGEFRALASRARSGREQRNVRPCADRRGIAREVRRGAAGRTRRVALRRGPRHGGDAARCSADCRRGDAGIDDRAAGRNGRRHGEPSQSGLWPLRGDRPREIRHCDRAGAVDAERNAGIHPRDRLDDGTSRSSWMPMD